MSTVVTELFYAEKFTTPLLRRAKIGNSIALIYHKEQYIESLLCPNCFQRGHLRKGCTNQVAFILCKASDHKAGDSGCIAKAKAPHKSLTAFQGHIDPLRNFYQVKEGIKLFGHVFLSVEHVYQYSKAIHGDQDSITILS